MLSIIAALTIAAATPPDRSSYDALFTIARAHATDFYCGTHLTESPYIRHLTTSFAAKEGLDRATLYAVIGNAAVAVQRQVIDNPWSLCK